MERDPAHAQVIEIIENMPDVTCGEPIMLDVRGVARMLGIRSRALRRLIRSGEFPLARHLGRHPRWHRDVVLAWAEKRYGLRSAAVTYWVPRERPERRRGIHIRVGDQL